MSWWRRSKAVDTASRSSPGADGPVIRLEGVSRVFKGDADEETWALRNVTLDIHARRVRLCVGTLGLRQVDVPLHAGASRHADVPGRTGSTAGPSIG